MGSGVFDAKQRPGRIWEEEQDHLSLGLDQKIDCVAWRPTENKPRT